MPFISRKKIGLLQEMSDIFSTNPDFRFPVKTKSRYVSQTRAEIRPIAEQIYGLADILKGKAVPKAEYDHFGGCVLIYCGNNVYAMVDAYKFVLVKNDHKK